MDEKKNYRTADSADEIEKAASDLIANAQDAEAESYTRPPVAGKNREKKSGEGEKASGRYRIKDIVFLAVITACTLVTGAVMPLLVNVPLFGIVQLGLGLQFSVFPVIGMMKVRKPGALLFQSLFISVFLIFMFPPMALIVVCALVAEALTLLFFRGYRSDWACVFAGTLYMPLTLPLMYLYYNAFYTVTGEEKAAMRMFLGGANAGTVVGISAAVVALCFVGSLCGMLVARELKKAGVLKK